MKLVEQNSDGNIIAVAYQDNGQMNVSVLDMKGEELDNIDVSDHLKLDRKSQPISGFYEPIMTCCFLPNDDLYINAYHRIEKKHYHFKYSYKDKKIISEVIERNIEDTSSGHEFSTRRNFPM